MRDGQRRWTWWVLGAMTLGTVGLGLATAGPWQEPEPRPPAKPQADGKAKADAKADADAEGKEKAKGGLRLPRQDPPKDKMGRLDPLGRAGQPGAAAPGPAAPGQPQAKQAGQAPAKGAANANAPGQPQAGQAPGFPKWPFHYELKILSGTIPLAVKYYPAEKPFEAPVVLMLHETGQGRSSHDFEEPIEELKKAGFAQYLQKQGFAVLLMDLRGHGANPRHDVTDSEWLTMVADLQAAYLFLVDRHNRGELNLGKFGIVALGDAGNLAAAWAATPGGGVSSEGRISDIGALVLVSPEADARGLALARILPRIAPRFPIMLISGDRDQKSIQPVRDAQPIVERHRLSKVAYFDSALHGLKLLSFFPKVPTAIEKFLNDPVKFRTVAWEPRYLLAPVKYAGINLVADSGYFNPAAALQAGAAPPKAGAAGAAPPKAAAGAPQPKAPAANKKGAQRSRQRAAGSKPSIAVRGVLPVLMRFLAMVLRMLVAAQILGVALLGAAARGTLLGPSARGWTESLVALGFYPVLIGFPVAVSFAMRRAALPRWKRQMITGIEVALISATMVAVLPLVQ